MTAVSHDSESRTHIGNIPACGGPGCYSKDVTYTGVNTAQLRALTRVHITANSSSSMRAIPFHDIWSLVLLGGWHATEQERITGVEPLATTKCAHAE